MAKSPAGVVPVTWPPAWFAQLPKPYYVDEATAIFCLTSSARPTIMEA